MLFRRISLVTFAAVFSLVFAGCTAELEEGCLAGECSPPGMPVVPSNSSSSSSSGGLSCDTTPATGNFPCDVFTVLQTHCHSCHQSPPLSNAPYSLLTYEDTRELNGATTIPRWQRIAPVVESGFMPLGKTMPDPDKQILIDWVSGCGLPAEDMGCE
jgi:hypothetical protein